MQSPTATPQKELVPRALLLAMALLVAGALALATYARVTDRPLEALPANGPISTEREIIIFAEMNGAAQVLDAGGMHIASLRPDRGGFVAGVQRALAHERGKHGVPEDTPVRLVRFEDGRLALFDDLTGWRMEIHGFGQDNTAAFARLLEK